MIIIVSYTLRNVAPWILGGAAGVGEAGLAHYSSNGNLFLELGIMFFEIGLSGAALIAYGVHRQRRERAPAEA